MLNYKFAVHGAIALALTACTSSIPETQSPPNSMPSPSAGPIIPPVASASLPPLAASPTAAPTAIASASASIPMDPIPGCEGPSPNRSAEIRGMIRGPEYFPIAGASLDVRSLDSCLPSETRLMTDRGGDFKADGFYPGQELELTLHLPNQAPIRRQIVVTPSVSNTSIAYFSFQLLETGGKCELADPLPQKDEIALQDVTHLTGEVVDANQMPVTGANVALYIPSLCSTWRWWAISEAGRFDIGIPVRRDREWVLEVTLPGQSPQTQTVILKPDKRGQPTNHVVFVGASPLSPQATPFPYPTPATSQDFLSLDQSLLTGSVRDAEGQLVEGALIEARPLNHTDPIWRTLSRQGQYRLYAPARVPLEISVTLPGREPELHSIVLKETPNQEPNINQLHFNSQRLRDPTATPFPYPMPSASS